MSSRIMVGWLIKVKLWCIWNKVRQHNIVGLSMVLWGKNKFKRYIKPKNHSLNLRWIFIKSYRIPQWHKPMFWLGGKHKCQGKQIIESG